MKYLPWLLAVLAAAFLTCQQSCGQQGSGQQGSGQQGSGQSGLGQPNPGQQDPKPVETKPADAESVVQQVLQQFKKEGIELDAKAETVTIKAVVNEPQDPLEYLLIHRKGKKHEAMFYTKSKPSVLNAALLMLGMQPGQNAKAEEIKPAPSIEEIEKGAETVKVTPPKGMTLWMTAKWTTPEGKAVEYCIEDLLLDLSTQKPVVDCTWVFLGGRMAKFYKDEPEVFAADMEGNLVSTCYMYPENQLLTIAHKAGNDQHNWWLTDRVPPPETEVEFVFHKKEPKIHIEREKRVQKEAAEEAKKKAAEPTEKKDEKKDGGEPDQGK